MESDTREKPRKRRRCGEERQKATMACIQCRSSKVKCDGVKPRCSRCTNADHRCSWARLDGRRSGARSRLSDDTSHASSSAPTNDYDAPTLHKGRPAAALNEPIWYPSNGSAAGLLPRRPTEEHSLWWEAGRNPAIPAAANDFDWSSLGLEPGDLTQEVLDTLSGQIAWLDHPTVDNEEASVQRAIGDQDDAQVVRIQYFRLLGPTGISPGIKKVSMEFRLTPHIQKALFDSTSPSALNGRQKLDWERLLSIGQAPTPQDILGPNQQDSQADFHVAFFEGDLPAQWVLDELIPIFFDRLGDHYLCLNRNGLEKRLAEAGQRIPPMLINIMCALAARYSTDPRIMTGRGPHQSHSFGIVFADKAKLFLASSLSIPSRTTTLAFLMMAWHEFACNLDSAFWMYAGMALRMAIDLGVHRNKSRIDEPRDLNDVDFIDDALLFWAVYQMDRVLAMGTGRPTNIKDREVTCPIPDEDIHPIFAHNIKLTRKAGEIAEALNAVLLPDDAARQEHIGVDKLEDELIELYELIPDQLHLTPQNFRATKDKHIFLEFHLRFHCLILILNRSPVVDKRTTVDPLQALQLVRKSVQRCADIIALDESQGGDLLISTPMANQTLFLAGCAELDELQQHQSRCNSNKDIPRSTLHLMRDAIESYSRFASVLERMSDYWDGIRWIYGVLKQRKAGFVVSDLMVLDVGTDTVASKQELRLLQRLHGSDSIQSGSASMWPPSVQVSQVMSVDELASVFPQFRS